jgi:hypothetical protein
LRESTVNHCVLTSGAEQLLTPPTSSSAKRGSINKKQVYHLGRRRPFDTPRCLHKRTLRLRYPVTRTTQETSITRTTQQQHNSNTTTTQQLHKRQNSEKSRLLATDLKQAYIFYIYRTLLSNTTTTTQQQHNNNTTTTQQQHNNNTTTAATTQQQQQHQQQQQQQQEDNDNCYLHRVSCYRYCGSTVFVLSKQTSLACIDLKVAYLEGLRHPFKYFKFWRLI